MNDSIWQSIAETSFWVYVLISYFLYLGYRGKKPQVVPVRALVLMTFGLALLSAACILVFVKLNATNISYWMIMCMLGMGLGWLQFSALRVNAITGMNNIYIPGSWFTLFVISMVLASYYITGSSFSFDPSALKAGIYSQYLMITYGLVTGFYFGRTFYAMRAVKFGPFFSP